MRTVECVLLLLCLPAPVMAGEEGAAPDEIEIHGFVSPGFLSTTAPRRKFTQDVIGRTVPAVKSYWQQVIFSGRDVPPPELDTDDKVIAYVRKNPGAIGYVSHNADVGDVKVVVIK